MSASSGITVSPELANAFGDAVNSQAVRFLKVSIRNESLVADRSEPPSGTFEEDFDKLGDLLEENVPAYVLVRLDSPPTDWLAVFFMLYAATRTSLTRSLGSAPFKDTLFATTKDEVTFSAYEKHRASLNAPKPMSAREREMDEIRKAESKSASYEGSRARTTHVHEEVGLGWPDDAKNAVAELGNGEASKLVILTIDPATETLQLHTASDIEADHVGSTLLPSDPCFAFFAWAQPSRRDIVFIYSCPSRSSVRVRMLYSSSAVSVSRAAGRLLDGGSTKLLSRRIETSDPAEIDEAFLVSDLESVLEKTAPQTAGQGSSGTAVAADNKPAFARPRGPARKR
ncbi:actin depolymerizing protein [Trametopsis cervina]|nr:actin depolymerizing protein [Trametopsis cervina]